MVEFLRSSAIYSAHQTNVSYFAQGHVFAQGDLRVRVGSITLNYPKYLLVQVYYEPSVFLRSDNLEAHKW